MRHAYFLTILICLALSGCAQPMGTDCAADPDAAECQGDSTVEGRVTDADGAQTRSFGGEGTVSAATRVEASAIASDGSLALLADAELQADGSYTLEVPASRDRLFLAAVDGSGEVLASAILERSAPPGERAEATPMDSESSLEAEVLVQMIAEGTAPAEANYADLRARITTEMAIAVRIAEARGEDTSVAVRAMAEATMAAQRAEIEAYANMGITVTQAELYQAELSASQSLSAALHAGSDGESAYAAFLAEIEAAAESQGADDEGRARSEGCASLAFRATIEARLSAEADGAIAESALLSAAALEARAQAQATEAILTAGAAGGEVMSMGQDAAAELRAEVRGSANAAAAASAYAAFAASVRGDADVSGSVLGSYVGVDLTTEAAVSAAVSASAEAAASLDTSLQAAIDASLSASGSIDTNALAADIVTAYSVYFDAVEAGTTGLAAASGEANASVAASLLIVADGSFRLAS